MHLSRRVLLGSAAAALAHQGSARAQAFDPNIKIGVLTNLSVFSDPTGTGSVEAAKLAVEDFLAAKPGTPLKPTVISADTQNKPDVASGIARQWLSQERVDLILDVPNSAAALAVSTIASAANRVMITTSSGSTRITGDQCNPTTLQWALNNYALSNAITKALIASGKKTWFFVTADYAFGLDLEAQATASIKAAGGQVLGHVRHPLDTSDFAAPLLQAQASGAQVIALANSVTDFSNALKQAAQFNISATQTMAGFLVTLTDINAIGLEIAQHLRLVAPFYWNTNDKTRAWTKRFVARRGKYPTFLQASSYSATLQFLKAVERAQTHDGAQIVEAMRAIPVEDDVYGKGTLRRDGLYTHDLSLYEVKTPGESTVPWDYYKKVGEISADAAYPPLASSACAAAKAGN